jgi:hypothetical protein
MTEAVIAGIGVCAPGMLDWGVAASVLRGGCAWRHERLPKLDVPMLPAAERRRVSPAARLAITAASQAMAPWPADRRASIASVFATADGDGQVLASTLQTLAQDAAAMSPTLFHNSVFNAPAGYWTIASQSRARSTTVSAGPGNVRGGHARGGDGDSRYQGCGLLVAADMPFPPSLATFGIAGEAFACALLLAPAGDAPAHGLGTLGIALREGDAVPDDVRIDAGIAAAFKGNPASARIAAPCDHCDRRGRRRRRPLSRRCRVEIAYAP